MRVLILGATGRVGRLVVDEALSRGHAVTALVRSPAKLDDVASRIKVLRGDVRDPGNIGAAVAQQDAVIYAVGAGNVRHTTLFSRSTTLLLDAMKTARVRRLICLTGVGAGETKGHGGFWYDWLVYPLFTRGIYADKERQEALITSGETDWTIVRPAPFRRCASSTPLQCITKIEPGTVLRQISFKEVATFLVDELERSTYVRQAVFIGHP